MTCYNIFSHNLVKFTLCRNKYKYMKNNFDELTLRYLSIYNEGYSSEYSENSRGHTPEQLRVKADIMSRIKTVGGSGGHEDNESEYGDHYRNDADSPRNNYGHSSRDGEYPDDVDYKDDSFNKSEDCSECGEEGCVDKDGHCHYCNPEDEDEDENEDGENYRPSHT